MTVSSDLIASLVQQEFDKLPTKRKPVVRDNGLREWVPLSGIVAEGIQHILPTLTNISYVDSTTSLRRCPNI